MSTSRRRPPLSLAVAATFAAVAIHAGLATPGATQPASKPSDRPAADKPASDRPASDQPAGDKQPDLDRLRAEHSALKDALFRSRARREILENALLSTQLIPVVRWEGARRYQLKTAELRLDGVRIWEAGSTPVGDKPITLAARGVPPGSHVLGVRLEVRSRENPKLGYTSEQSFAVALPEGKKTTIEITVDEDGDPPSYNPDIEIAIDTD